MDIGGPAGRREGVADEAICPWSTYTGADGVSTYTGCGVYIAGSIEEADLWTDA